MQQQNSYNETNIVTFSRVRPPPYTPATYGIPTVSGTVDVLSRQKVPKTNSPVFVTCPSCNGNIVTRVEHRNTRKTHMMAGFICGFTCWCMLCCLSALPYVIPMFKKATHYCPNCKAFLGTYSII